MEIVFHAHHATVSQWQRRRAEEALRGVARRVSRPVDCVIRFEQDGSVRRVEVTLHTASSRRFFAQAEGRFFGPLLADTMRRLRAQVDHDKRSLRSRARKRATAGAR